ncbi:MAG TPA: carbon-nitrogen hydrolase family protein [Mariprofundaceae bacterium]|nr:carbon-nitrogen hydrolase family protein [Mariprofundaceae bacterium]
MADKARRVKVAAVQMHCEAGETGRNLAHAGELVGQAVAQGAQLVLLPELMPGGYTLTEAIWDSAETMDGRSVTWLQEQARQHHIHIGFSFLEAEGEDFYNSFVLAGPVGGIAGRVRKNPPASVEAFFYRAGSDAHVIDTELGRIGISICYENLLYDRICELAGLSVDFVLSPSAAGRPKKFIPGDLRRFEEMLKRWRHLYADVLGVPNIMANRTGPLVTELPSIYPFLRSSFPGLSYISDANGHVLAELGEEEGVIVADIELDAALRKSDKPRRYGSMWALPVPWYALTWPMSQHPGEKDYAANPRRIARAREQSSTDDRR